MGHLLTQNGLKIDPAKVEAVRNMPPPTNKKEFKRLLGRITYLSKFIANFSEKTSVIRTLLNDSVEFQWDEKVHGAAFDELKELLQTAPVLRYYDVSKPITIQGDDSSTS